MKNKKALIFTSIVILMIISLGTYLYKPSKFTAMSLHGKSIHCERGYVRVPVLREEAKSKSIKVNYVRLKSFSENPQTPIFFLAGGPGESATWQAENEQYLEYWATFLETRDVILVDQRGAGKISLWWIKFGWPPKDIFVSSEVAIDHFKGMASKAAKAFQKRGIELNGYNSIESAHDINAVRKQLGYQKIIPFGFSYGTHLGQSFIKYHNDKVEKAILIGVEGLNHTFKLPSDLDNHFAMISDLVAKDSLLNQQIPSLIDLYHEASNKLKKEPVEVEITTPIKLKRKVLVGKFGLDFILKRDLGDASDIPHFPKLLHNIVHGDGSALQWYAEKRFREFMGIPGMLMSMDLSSGASIDRIDRIIKEEEVSMFGKVANLPFMDLHELWPVRDLGKGYRSTLETSIPTLFLSGSLDVNTPAYQADEVMKGFSKGTHLVVQNAGHEQIQFHWDMSKTILAFLHDEDVSEVKMAYPPLKFKTIAE